MSSPPPITLLLARARRQDRAALDDLFTMVYEELHGLARSAMRNEGPGHTLQPTALLHEAYLRLFGSQTPDFSDRAHFFGVAARVMRQVLVDHARTRGARKRGSGLQVELGDAMNPAKPASDLLELDEALDKLGSEDPRLATLIEMRFFAGMTAEETAEARFESVYVVRHDLRYAQAQLRRIMAGGA